jgi:hypothetical protein
MGATGIIEIYLTGSGGPGKQIGRKLYNTRTLPYKKKPQFQGVAALKGIAFFSNCLKSDVKINQLLDIIVISGLYGI